MMVLLFGSVVVCASSTSAIRGDRLPIFPRLPEQRFSTLADSHELSGLVQWAQMTVACLLTLRRPQHTRIVPINVIVSSIANLR